MGLPSHKIPKRVVIYATDIEMLTGLCTRSVYRLMSKIRVAYGKKPRAFITIDEFCDYTGIGRELVLERIGG